MPKAMYTKGGTKASQHARQLAKDERKEGILKKNKKNVVHAIDKIASSCVTALHTVIHAIHATTRVAYSVHWSPTSATVHTRASFFF